MKILGVGPRHGGGMRHSLSTYVQAVLRSHAAKKEILLTKYSTQLDQHPETGKCARLTEVSMADDGFADSFRLIGWSPMFT
jgi:hypothetical protein